jgi:hypothetical protein
MVSFNLEEAIQLRNLLQRFREAHHHEWSLVRQRWEDLKYNWQDVYCSDFEQDFQKIIHDQDDILENIERQLQRLERSILIAERMNPVLGNFNCFAPGIVNSQKKTAESATQNVSVPSKTAKRSSSKGQSTDLPFGKGDSTKLGENLVKKGVPRPKSSQAHHIIPSAIANRSELMLRLNAFPGVMIDINCAENGIFLPTTCLGYDLLPTHRGSHPRYSNYAADILQLKWEELESYKMQDEKVAVMSAIEDAIKDLKKLIKTQGEFLRFSINDC